MLKIMNMAMKIFEVLFWKFTTGGILTSGNCAQKWIKKFYNY